jgi:hypothetical protein
MADETYRLEVLIEARASGDGFDRSVAALAAQHRARAEALLEGSTGGLT